MPVATLSFQSVRFAGAVANGFFIAGTDTGVGKTYVACALLSALSKAGRRAVGMKPVASGCRLTSQGLRNDDADTLMLASAVQAPYAEVNPYAFAPPISPHIAAQEAGTEIDPDIVRQRFSRLAKQADRVVVEGAGGWLTPIGERLTMADIAVSIGLPVVLVVGMRLGCLNQALLTQEAIARSTLPFAGWIANCVDPAMDRLEENVDTLRRRLRAPLWALLPRSPTGVSQSVVDHLTKVIAISE